MISPGSPWIASDRRLSTALKASSPGNITVNPRIRASRGPRVGLHSGSSLFRAAVLPLHRQKSSKRKENPFILSLAVVWLVFCFRFVFCSLVLLIDGLYPSFCAQVSLSFFVFRGVCGGLCRTGTLTGGEPPV